MVGMQEMIIVGGIIALLFGAKKLPEMGRSLGEGIREFKRSMEGIRSDDGGVKAPEDPECEVKAEKERL